MVGTCDLNCLPSYLLFILLLLLSCANLLHTIFNVKIIYFKIYLHTSTAMDLILQLNLLDIKGEFSQYMLDFECCRTWRKIKEIKDAIRSLFRIVCLAKRFKKIE